MPAPDAILVDGRLAAQQWELHLGGAALRAGAAAWTSAPLLSFRAFAERLYRLGREDGSPEMLTAGQSAALWREVVADSPEGAGLLGIAGLARWAEDAHARLAAWRLGPETAAGERDEDFAAFLRWSAGYRERMAAHRWLDAADLVPRLLGSSPPAPGRLECAAPFEPTPAREALFAHLSGAGWRIGARAAGLESPGRAARIGLPDEERELAAAAAWAVGTLERHPDTRVAVVLPGLADRSASVRRAFAAAGAPAGTVHVATGAAGADARPLVGAALNALELLSPQGGFTELSRWLRSSLFGQPDTAERAAAAGLEAALRRELLAQLPFEEAYRRAGLGARLRAAVPRLAVRLEAALELHAPPGALRSPSHWARLWQRALDVLEWGAGTAADEELQAFARALDELALLTPIVGRVSVGRALAELERIVAGQGGGGPLPAAGIHVLERLEDVGPGYAAAWAAGLTSTALPRPVVLNPLLPRRLQVRHAMPWSSPADALMRSRALLDGLCARVPEAVLSWPAREHDNPAEPSPLLRGLPALDSAGLPGPQRARSAGAPRRRESVAEPRVPAVPGRLPGGTRALNAAARCPLRAFCEFRLGASALEPVTRGLPARLKGIALHAAVEKFYRQYNTFTALAAAPGEALRAAQHAAIEAALDAVFGAARSRLRGLYELERLRATAILADFVRRELARAEFEVAAVERRQSVEIGRWHISTRVDRIDRLGDGALAIIDYKTGHSSRPADWFAPRPRDCQLPVYAIAADGELAALVIASLAAAARAGGYSGIWTRSDDFPGRSRPLPEGRSLAQQIAVWRADLATLVEEFAAGDVRLFADDLDAARGPYAPLTRVDEQLALHRGWLRPW